MENPEASMVIEWDEFNFRRLLRIFDIPQEAEPTYPPPGSSGDNPPSGMITIYAHHVIYGHLRLPFTRFFIDLLLFYGIHPNRLHPLGVMKAKHFEYCCLALRRLPSVDSFNLLFRAVFCTSGITFARRRESPALVTGLPTDLPNWKQTFFYVTDRVLPPSLTADVVLQNIDPPLETAYQSDSLCQALLARTVPYQPIPEAALAAMGMSRKWVHIKHVPYFMDPDTRESKLSSAYFFLTLMPMCD
jgi:hypothetical protein